MILSKSLLAACTIFFITSCSAGRSLTTDELSALLNIHYWRVLENNGKKQWTVYIQNTSQDVVPVYSQEKLKEGGSLIAVQNIGNHEYKYSLFQNNGVSSGSFKLDYENMKIEWFDRPKGLSGGKYAIGQATRDWPFNQKVNVLIVIELIDVPRL